MFVLSVELQQNIIYREVVGAYGRLMRMVNTQKRENGDLEKETKMNSIVRNAQKRKESFRLIDKKNNMKRKINYQKKWDKDGYCYTQGINITEKELEKIQYTHLLEYWKNELDKENKIDYDYKLFLGSPNDCERKDSVVFTNHTQRDFFAKVLKIKLKDRNTCFIINS